MARLQHLLQPSTGADGAFKRLTFVPATADTDSGPPPGNFIVLNSPQQLTPAADSQVHSMPGAAVKQPASQHHRHHHQKTRELFKEEDVQLHWTSRELRVGAGLANLGNTCFMNSVLQCLTHTPPLAEAAVSGKLSKAASTDPSDPLLLTAQHIVRSFNSQSRYIAPEKHFRTLRMINKRFRQGRQEDSHEYLRCLLDAMHETCLKPFKPKPPPELAATTVIARIFGGKLRSRIKCHGVSYESSTYEDFMDLSLEITRAPSVLRALQHFTSREMLDGDNKYRCPTNGKLVRAEKQMTIERAPNVLTIHLKRFQYGGFGAKITKHVEFSNQLDLQHFMSDSNCGPQMYDLYGVLVHLGHTVHSGHYYCFVRAPNGLWHRCDDTSVGVVGERNVMAQMAYILFYVRREPRAGSHAAKGIAPSPQYGPAPPPSLASKAQQQQSPSNKKQQQQPGNKEQQPHTREAALANGEPHAMLEVQQQVLKQLKRKPDQALAEEASASPQQNEAPARKHARKAVQSDSEAADGSQQQTRLLVPLVQANGHVHQQPVSSSRQHQHQPAFSSEEPVDPPQQQEQEPMSPPNQSPVDERPQSTVHTHRPGSCVPLHVTSLGKWQVLHGRHMLKGTRDVLARLRASRRTALDSDSDDDEQADGGMGHQEKDLAAVKRHKGKSAAATNHDRMQPASIDSPSAASQQQLAKSKPAHKQTIAQQAARQASGHHQKLSGLQGSTAAGLANGHVAPKDAKQASKKKPEAADADEQQLAQPAVVPNGNVEDALPNSSQLRQSKAAAVLPAANHDAQEKQAAKAAARPAAASAGAQPQQEVTGAAAAHLLMNGTSATTADRSAFRSAYRPQGQARTAWDADGDEDTHLGTGLLTGRTDNKRRRDYWDEEYDRGKVKKVRSQDKPGADLHKDGNAFQLFQEQRRQGGGRSPHGGRGSDYGRGEGRGGRGGGRGRGFGGGRGGRGFGGDRGGRGRGGRGGRGSPGAFRGGYGRGGGGGGRGGGGFRGRGGGFRGRGRGRS